MKDGQKIYDRVFKEALVLFKDKTLSFLGLEGLAPIMEPLTVENTEIEIKSEFADLTFRLGDDRGLHFEEEVHLSPKDLIRFCKYHIWLSEKYAIEFISVIFVRDPVQTRALNWEQLKFTPIVIDCSTIDADAILAKLRRGMAEGAPVNELELIYLPLFRSETLTPTGLFKASQALIQELPTDDRLKQKICALSILLAGKIVAPPELAAAWKEVKRMGNIILEFAEAQGFKDGMTEGVAQNTEATALKMRTKGYDPQEIIELTGIDPERLREICVS
jgi:hypothetical protein